MVGMGSVGGGEQVARGPPGRQVVGSADLLANHFDFFGELRRIEGGVADGVAKDIQAHLGELARQHDVVHGLVKRGPGVDLPAALLDLPRNFSRSASKGSLEQHVLVQVRQTGLVRPLIRASCIHPDLESSDLRRMLLLKDHPETVVELKALSHRLGKLTLGGQGRKRWLHAFRSDSVSHKPMTKSGSNDGNPVLDLREILGDEDEPLGPTEGIPPIPTAVAPVAKAPPTASPGPPPLPTKRASAARPAPGAQGAGAPGLFIPPPLGRPSGDPFQEPVEPRLPRGLPEEKVEFFRTVLKQKQETIARARAIYAEREQEADQIREAVQALNARLEAALAESERLREL